MHPESPPFQQRMQMLLTERKPGGQLTRDIDISEQYIYIKYEIYFIYILNCVRVQYLSLHSIKGGVSDNLFFFFFFISFFQIILYKPEESQSKTNELTNKQMWGGGRKLSNRQKASAPIRCPSPRPAAGGGAS